tara:strand:+ start:1397 stop:1942 length:546 start_codon:yes stop_codon:yes gene_type:complete
MKVEDLKFIHFLTAALVVELFMLFLFRFTNSPFTGFAINNWYDTFRWVAILLDVLSVVIGFYIAKYIYSLLLKKDVISKDRALLKFIVIMLAVQIIHDIGFYVLVISKTKPGVNDIMDGFIQYAEKVQAGAILGDSFMYLLATPLLVLLLKNNDENNVFISLVSLYVMGYFVYQKPSAQLN